MLLTITARYPISTMAGQPWQVKHPTSKPEHPPPLSESTVRGFTEAIFARRPFAPARARLKYQHGGPSRKTSARRLHALQGQGRHAPRSKRLVRTIQSVTSNHHEVDTSRDVGFLFSILFPSFFCLFFFSVFYCPPHFSFFSNRDYKFE